MLVRNLSEIVIQVGEDGVGGRLCLARGAVEGVWGEEEEKRGEQCLPDNRDDGCSTPKIRLRTSQIST